MSKRTTPARARQPKARPSAAGERVTYRELRNTPGQVWDRLAKGEMLTLVAEGEVKAILVSVVEGDVSSAREAVVRGRAMLAASRLRRQARESSAGAMSIDDINALIRKTRESRHKATRRA
jgi:antitoxin (DNA-binding transcriptional repressor) of toxin-antitoxin stability system